MSRTSPWVIVVALISAAACGPETKPVVEARKQPCTQWCEALVAPCPNKPSSAFTTAEECVRSCATVGSQDGEWDKFWGYDPSTGKDACFDENAAYYACGAALTDQEFCSRFQPFDERPCQEEEAALDQCGDALKQREGGA